MASPIPPALPTICLLSLPNELLLLIAETLSDQMDVNSLLQANRRLSIILRDHLLKRNIKHHGSSALLWAAANNHHILAERLIILGADLDLTCKSLYKRFGKRKMPWLKSISIRGGSAHRGEEATPLCYAVKNQNLSMVRLLVGAGASVSGKSPFAPFLVACDRRDKAMICELRKGLKTLHDSVAGNERDRLEPLELAVLKTWAWLVKRLLEDGANLNHRMHTDGVPLMIDGLYRRSVRTDAEMQILELFSDYGVTNCVMDSVLAQWRTRQQCPRAVMVERGVLDSLEMLHLDRLFSVEF